MIGWIPAAIPTLVPLVFNPAGYFIFLPIKLALAQVLVLLGLAGLLFSGRGLARSVLLAGWARLLVVFVAAAVLGTGGLTSWIGYPGRSLGIIAWIIFAAAFWLGGSLADREERERVVRVASAASILVSAYALLQAAGIDPIEWSESLDITRPRSSLGNAAFLGAYLALIVPLTGRLAMSGSEPHRLRAIHGLATLLGTAALLATQTRGAWLGVIGAGLVMVVLEFGRLRAAPSRFATALGVAAIAIVLLATVSPVASRVRSIVDPSVGTGRGRLIQWERTLDLISERPVLGWGPETYAFTFPQFIDARFERTVAREVIPDRAHNIFLDIAAAAGLFGAIAYLAIVGMIVRVVARLKERDPLTVGLAGACVAYLIQLQFSFPAADLDVVFWLFAGLLVASPNLRTIVGSRHWALLPCSAALVLGAWGASDVVADRGLRRALEAEANQHFDQALSLAESAAAAAPGRIQYLQADTRLHRRVGETLGRPEDFSRGLEIVDRALRLMPRDLELAMDRADLLLSWGQVQGDGGLIEDAAAQYEDILSVDPASSRAQLKVGVAYVELGRTQDAEEAWLTAASLSPRSPGPLLNLGLLYEREERAEDARRMLERVLRLDPSNSVARDALQRLGV